ncbi:gustatory receptor for bitter taste 66a-like [Anopheles albimanus]|uniref:gustatory receptor for bitter taste 66a-like n=1 Tax=Anopheles albimanus TaxID=7167 RepID=UPI001641BBDF|nr:gustatory receptor for bitter taste 66a-like [Anopheles albimanus]
MLEALRDLFYVSAIFGVIPLSLRMFFKRRVLQLSISGNVWVVCNIVVYTALYHVATTNYIKDDWGSQKTLTNAIGIFIIYMEPLMMGVDMISGMINQRRLIECFERLQRVDTKLAAEGIPLNNQQLRRITMLLGFLVFLFEMVITGYSFVEFEHDFTFSSSIWFITTIPTALNSVCRIWFIILVHAIRQRFNAMNGHMNEIAQGLQQFKDQQQGHQEADPYDVPLDYLEREIFTVYTQRKAQFAVTPPKKQKQKQASAKIIQVKPYEAGTKLSSSPLHRNSNAIYPTSKPDGVAAAAQQFLPTDIRQRPKIDQRMDSKLILICRTHDELCEIGKIVNRMYSVQMLVAMAHGFVAITAQLYFLYCGLTGQEVPILFRSAQVLLLSLTYVCYTALKCVVPIFVCWKTKTDSRRTGIEMHYLANVIDESHYYEVVNHLSLKLLNHHLNFSACGFFDLDMTTLYAITGAVTSYLIILIQFNLAAIQKTTGNATLTTNTSSSTTALALIDGVSTALTTYSSRNL